MTRKNLTEDDKTLWKQVIKSVTPLQTSSVILPEEPPVPPTPLKKQSRKTRTAEITIPHPNQNRPQQFDPAIKRKIARSTQTIDATLDLHGLSQQRAHHRLGTFIDQSRTRGHRIILVITGKGSSSQRTAGEKGILRQMLPLWLSVPEYRKKIVAFEQAHDRHGGAGAFYIHLKRNP